MLILNEKYSITHVVHCSTMELILDYEDLIVKIQTRIIRTTIQQIVTCSMLQPCELYINIVDKFPRMFYSLY